MPLLPLQTPYVGPVIRVLATGRDLFLLRCARLVGRNRVGEGEERERGVADENDDKAECSRLHPEVF